MACSRAIPKHPLLGIIPAHPAGAALRRRRHHHYHHHHNHRPLLLPSPTRSCNVRKRPFSLSTTTRMPSYIVTCKDDATPDQVEAAKKHAKEQGGTIGHEYSLIKGFSVSFPNDAITTLESHEHVKAVEKDGQMHTQ
ncbi:hypothetical protein JDV02_007981 [Purpureocillium takamizusanense]|uniref:Inhibitor I9 domain-containing protein n=1 Tax=Purpureocillium takamizusanense TaxID=2060973 RepID=A0A9Q8QPA2_9HYPO|nr:uncharacterized protein JDV02_007981 [Purpureocillium takamizusanense]UNI22057.1 hypothetical protein JDV02_007981 [Purpureocillium takamizusanense]